MTTQAPSMVALIPARAGSKRLPMKNVRRLAGHPLIAHTIVPAVQSGVFSAVVVSTDAEPIACVARHYGGDVPFLRPEALAHDLSPDIDWVEYTLLELERLGRSYDCFCLLRPTSPFRTPEMLRRAWQIFCADPTLDSMRAVEKCRQHPGKMWVVRGQRLLPLLPLASGDQPWHSCAYQSLPTVYAQNASLEIAWTRVVFQGRTIAGEVLAPFFTVGYEGFDINEPSDWLLAEQLIQERLATPGASGIAVSPETPLSSV